MKDTFTFANANGRPCLKIKGVQSKSSVVVNYSPWSTMG